jgi:hypothetical protein
LDRQRILRGHRMPKLATLDDDHIVTALVDVPEQDWTDSATQVRVPDNCDLKPGLYRWTGSEFRWVGATDDVALVETKALAMIVLALIDIKLSAPATINYRDRVTDWLTKMRAVITALKQD